MKTAFLRKFAPHLSLGSLELGTLSSAAGPDPVAQARLAAALGFSWLEDNFFLQRSPEDQERLSREMERSELRWGCAVATLDFRRPTMSLGTSESRDQLVGDLVSAMSRAKAFGIRQMTIMPGFRSPGISDEVQRQNAVQALTDCAEAAQKHGIKLCLEPITRARFPENLLFRPDLTAEICREIASPYLTLLYDVYHVVAENLDPVEQLSICYDQIGTVQISNFPERLEPGAGSLDLQPILKQLSELGYDGVIGLEHTCSGAGIEGARAMAEAYHRIEGARIGD